MARLAGFIQDTALNIGNLLLMVDAWSALQQENNAMSYATTVQQTDLDAVFGVGAVTVAQYQAALSAMQAIVDSVHVQTTAAKLYRLKR